jgi:hypothetical protein
LGSAAHHRRQEAVPVTGGWSTGWSRWQGAATGRATLSHRIVTRVPEERESTDRWTPGRGSSLRRSSRFQPVACGKAAPGGLCDSYSGMTRLTRSLDP